MSGLITGNQVTNNRNVPGMTSGLFADRPATGYSYQVYIAYDTQQIFQYISGSWVLIAGGGSGSGTTLQQVTTAGNSTTNPIKFTAEDGVSVSNRDKALLIASIFYPGVEALVNFQAALASVYANVAIEFGSTSHNTDLIGDDVNVEAAGDLSLSSVTGAVDIGGLALKATSGSASLTLAPGAGTGASSSIDGNNIRGNFTITLGTGATGSPNVVVATLNFSTALPSVPKSITFSRSGTSGVAFYINLASATTTSVEIQSAQNLSGLAGTAIQISYYVLL